MTLESIEKLRKALKDCTSVSGVEPNQFDTYWITAAACDKCIDEIEREIAERYMELPLDADGKPIRVGDVVTWLNGAPSSKFTIDTFVFDMEHGEWDVKDSNFLNVFPAHRCRHVKPRTVEDVLDEMADEIIRQGHQAGLTAPGIIAKYADELRGMGVGE